MLYLYPRKCKYVLFSDDADANSSCYAAIDNNGTYKR